MTAHFLCRRNIPILLALFLSVLAPSFTSAKTVALFPLKYHSEQPKKYLYKGISSMLSNRIAGGDIVVSRPDLPGQDAKQIAEKSSDIRWVIDTAKSLGAEYAVIGNLKQIGAGFTMDLDLIELAAGEKSTKKIAKTAAGENQVFAMVTDAANEVRTLIGLPAMSGRRISSGSRQGLAESGQMTVREGAEQQETGMFTSPHPEKLLTESVEFTMPRRSDVESFHSLAASDSSSKRTRPPGFPDIHRPKGMIRIPAKAMSFDIGDLDNDGIFEFIVLDREKIQIYKEVAESRGFAAVDTIVADTYSSYLKVSTGDFNKNGKAEIYAVSLYGSGARSEVWEWDGPGKFRKIAEMSGHLQVLKSTTSPDLFVLNQKSTGNDMFVGPISMLELDANKKYVVANTLSLPRGAQLYTLSMADVNGDGTREIAGLDSGSYLTIWDAEGNILAQSDDSLGGTANTILQDDDSGNPQADVPPPVPLNSRTIIADISGDGKPEVLAVNNILMIRYLTQLNLYSKHKLIAYNPSDMTPVWNSGEMPDCLVEIQSIGNVVCLAVQETRYLNRKSKQKTEIWWFER